VIIVPGYPIWQTWFFPCMLSPNVQAGTYYSLLYSFLFYWISLWRYAISCKRSLWTWLSPTDTYTHSYSATQYSFSSRIPTALLSLVIAYSKLTARVFFTVQNHLTDVFKKKKYMYNRVYFIITIQCIIHFVTICLQESNIQHHCWILKTGMV